jgi:hypothetical protein
VICLVPPTTILPAWRPEMVADIGRCVQAISNPVPRQDQIGGPGSFKLVREWRQRFKVFSYFWGSLGVRKDLDILYTLAEHLHCC